MSRLDELINELCPNGVEFKCLGDIGQVKMCKRILKSQTNTNGGIPFYKIGTFGGEANAFISEELFQEYREKYSYPKVGEILISAAGTIGRTVVYDGEPAYYQDSNIVWLAHDESNILNTFLRYCYELKPWNISSGGTIARLYNDNILKAKVPVPPLEVQREIVHILDNFTELTTELTAKLTAELTARKKQYEFYRNKLLTFGDVRGGATSDVIWRTLGEVIVSLKTGLNPRQFFKLNTDDACNYYVTIREIQNGTIAFSDKTDKINDEALKLCNNRSNLEVGDVLFSGTGTIGETAVISKPPTNWNIKEGVYVIKPRKDMINSRFLMYILRTDVMKAAIAKKVAGGTVKSIPMAEMRKLQIPVPPLDTQKRLVNVLDNFESICTDLNIGLPAEIEARKKQYEYYRDKLLSFKELPK